VARLLDGEGMSDVCRQFGISRKTGYKIWDRYRQEGLEALRDRSRRPVRYANRLPDQIERLIVETKKGKPHCGAMKIRSFWCADWPARFASRPPRRCTPCSTAMAR
ncbi:helix-turn-helix domain-containing protein, partial [Aquibium sp. A9E412]|uniref:helix-turn-helix domain-containing protein n=1 Tax=Aquibium sp. A9E412 TaxID=2976767 RepID=UPI0025B1A729